MYALIQYKGMRKRHIESRQTKKYLHLFFVFLLFLVGFMLIVPTSCVHRESNTYYPDFLLSED